MTMLKRLLLALGLLTLAPIPAFAQNLSGDEVVLYARRDLDSSSFEYCRTVGLNGNASDRNIPGRVLISTSGSSTTVTGTNAFANVGVGDVLIINDAGVVEKRSVVARASANSITVGSAIDITSARFDYRKIKCGTADTDGAFQVSGDHSFTLQIILSQENSASTDYQIECRVAGPGSSWSIVGGPYNDTTTFNDIWSTDLPFTECRVGVKVNTDDGSDTGADAEQFTVILHERK